MSEADGLNIAEEVARLTEKADRQLRATYAKLTAWQKTQVARHPERPKANDYIAALITDFTPLAGDRAFADDAADHRRARPVPRPLGDGDRHREGHRHRKPGRP